MFKPGSFITRKLDDLRVLGTSLQEKEEGHYAVTEDATILKYLEGIRKKAEDEVENVVAEYAHHITYQFSVR